MHVSPTQFNAVFLINRSTSSATMTRAPPAKLVINSAPVAPYSGPADPFSVQNPIDPYTLNNAHLLVDVKMLSPAGFRALPLPSQVEHKFSRVVYVLKYHDTPRLRAILDAVAEANAVAMQMEHLPRRALCNVQLTPEQRSDRSNLDVISGFTVVDSDYRILCLEGLKHGNSIPALYRSFPRTAAHSDDGSRYLQNSSLSFRHRLWSNFDLDIKAVKLTRPLMTIIRDPNMFTRSHIPDECYQALRKLSQLRQCERLSVAKSSDLFLRVPQLLALEKRFGGFVSDDDIDGAPLPNSALASTDSNLHATSAPGDKNTVRFGGAPMPSTLADPAAQDELSNHFTKSMSAEEIDEIFGDGSSRKSSSSSVDAAAAARKRAMSATQRMAATDCQNDAYLQAKLAQTQKPPVDFVAKHISDHTARFRKERPVGPMPPGGVVFPYAGQKLNYNEWLAGQMRSQRIHDTDHAYFYGSSNTLAFPMAEDERDIKHREMELTKSRRVAPHDFHSSLHREPYQIDPHPKRPTDFRVQELHEPWVEHGVHGNALDNRRVTRAEVEEFRRLGKPLFTPLPAPPGIEFGMPDNPHWGQSVHIGGDGVEAEAIERARQAKEEWRRKVVVDDPVFHTFMATAQRPDKTIPVDRQQTLLHDPPKKKSLIYEEKLAVRPPPVSIMASDGSWANGDGGMTNMMKTLTRKANPSKFIAEKNFFTPMFPESSKSEVAKRAAPAKPLRSAEMRGPLFRNSSAGAH
jgi:hypothetical protein